MGGGDRDKKGQDGSHQSAGQTPTLVQTPPSFGYGGFGGTLATGGQGYGGFNTTTGGNTVFGQWNPLTKQNANSLALQATKTRQGSQDVDEHKDAKGIFKIILELILELGLSASVNPFTGNIHFTINLNRFAKIAKEAGWLDMVGLSNASNGANIIDVKANIWDLTYAISASNLEIASFTTPTFTAGKSELAGVTISGDDDSAHVSLGYGKMDAVTFKQGANQVSADWMDLAFASFDMNMGAVKSGEMAFQMAHIVGLRYPGAPPITFTLRNGATFSAIWTRDEAKDKVKETKQDLALVALPPVLPADAWINIDLDGVFGDGAITDKGASGAGGFKKLEINAYRNNAELAAVVIKNAYMVGQDTYSGIVLQQVVLRGDPGMVDALLASKHVATSKAAQRAVETIQNLGLRPEIGASLTLNNVIGGGNPAHGMSVQADVALAVDIAGTGHFRFDLKGAQAAMQMGAGGDGGLVSFTSFDAALTDTKGKDVAHVTLTGGAASKDAKGEHAEVKITAVHGDVGYMLKSAKGAIKTLPPTVRQALGMVASLGVGVDVTGDVEVDRVDGTKGTTTTVDGDLHAHITSVAGRVDLDVSGFTADASGSTGSFGHFQAKLNSAKGKEIAAVVVDGASGTKNGAFQAKNIEVRGDTEDVSSLLHTLKTKAKSLPPALLKALDVVDDLILQGHGKIDLKGVKLTPDGHGGEVASLKSFKAGFGIDGVGTAAVAIDGLQGHLGGDKELGFDQLDIQVADLKGKPAMHILLQGAHVEFDKAPADDPGHGDFDIQVKLVQISGDTVPAANVLAGLRKNLNGLGIKTAKVFEVIEHYALDFPTQHTVTITDADVKRTDMQMSEQGNVAVTIDVGGLALEVKSKGYQGGPDGYRFDELLVQVRQGGPQGAIGASLIVSDASMTGDASTIKIDHIAVTGDQKVLLSALDPKALALLPPKIAAVLGFIDGAALDIALSDVTVNTTAGPNGNPSVEVGKFTFVGNVNLLGSKGETYAVPSARITAIGAKVVFGPDFKLPRMVDAAHLEIGGQVATTGGVAGGVSGSANVSAGRSHVELDDAGNVTKLDVQDVHASADITAQTQTLSSLKPASVIDPVKDTPQQQADKLDKITPGVTTATGMLKNADIVATVPMTPGRYGKLIHLEVLPGTVITVNVQIREHLMAAGTSVHIAPALDLPLWFKANGVNLDVDGKNAALKTDVEGFFDINITKYLAGSKALAADVPGMVGAIMHHMHDQLLTKEPPDPDQVEKGKIDEAKDKDWVTAKHKDWEETVAKHQVDGVKNPKKKAKWDKEDAASEPRSARLAGIASADAFDLSKAHATADLDLEGGILGTRPVHFHGVGDGAGTVELSVDDVVAQLGGGNSVSVTNLQTGQINVDKQPDAVHVDFQSFTIGSLALQLAPPAKK